jgi:hypothetical protein
MTGYQKALFRLVAMISTADAVADLRWFADLMRVRAWHGRRVRLASPLLFQDMNLFLKYPAVSTIRDLKRAVKAGRERR